MSYAMKISPLKEWRVAAAGFGLLGGILCGLLGSLLTGISWFAREPHNHQMLHTLGGTFLCLTIPLLALGALCMDGLDKGASGTKASLHKTEADDDD